MSNKKQRDQNRANSRWLVEYLQSERMTRLLNETLEEDRRFGQPHYGHDENERHETTPE
jgi:hypothetical protein